MNKPEWMILEGDCRQELPTLGPNSVDAIVTDPPYELGFMGKKWDASGISCDLTVWAECLRVLKPGGHLLAFGGTRTYHRMTCAIEDAGFEIRDCLQWLYGTGFPKSLNVGEGRGTALKPAHEPIVLARKPLIGTVAANIEAHGTGGINIDECRIGTEGGTKGCDAGPSNGIYGEGLNGVFGKPVPGLGRFPANVLLDDDAAAMLDAQSGVSKSAGGRIGKKAVSGVNIVPAGSFTKGDPGFGDVGGASRFFYVAKASRSERDAGVCGEHQSGGDLTDRKDGSAGLNSPRAGAGRTSGGKNTHPTVKPIMLLRYLVRLVTPPGGVVLDPFTGSGTTGIAALQESRSFIGIELTPEYVEIARQRLMYWERS